MGTITECGYDLVITVGTFEHKCVVNHVGHDITIETREAYEREKDGRGDWKTLFMGMRSTSASSFGISYPLTLEWYADKELAQEGHAKWVEAWDEQDPFAFWRLPNLERNE